MYSPQRCCSRDRRVPQGQHAVAYHEVLYVFPPLALVRATVEKACADRALCVLIVLV